MKVSAFFSVALIVPSFWSRKSVELDQDFRGLGREVLDVAEQVLHFRPLGLDQRIALALFLHRQVRGAWGGATDEQHVGDAGEAAPSRRARVSVLIGVRSSILISTSTRLGIALGDRDMRDLADLHAVEQDRRAARQAGDRARKDDLINILLAADSARKTRRRSRTPQRSSPA